MKSEDKFYYIGEVSEIVGVPSHIIRYWEKEFSFLKPLRDQRGHRIYTEKEIEKIKRIKNLIYGEGYRIRGAKKKLKEKLRKSIEVEESLKFLKKLLKELKEMEKCLQ
ncbi:MAG TPA: MerR family transcriptional regulator [Firmicutes bacterium]|nr:MAG: MerR family transcriptional regulator [Candidatus Omnitrophota bacterium]HDD64868.1 MerR family transcriptional regulator [Bacillota bacterium]